MVSLSFLSSSTKRPLWQGQLLVVLCVVVFSLLGIGTRTSGYLASFWGTNAVMLGLLLRNPSAINMLDGCALSLPCHVPGELPVA